MQSLRSGVSETSVRAAAGWSGEAMVARYTRALLGELAVAARFDSWIAPLSARFAGFRYVLFVWMEQTR